MNRTIMAWIGLGLYLGCLGGSVQAADKKPGVKAAPVTLTGTYIWMHKGKKKNENPLKAVFTPDGAVV